MSTTIPEATTSPARSRLTTIAVLLSVLLVAAAAQCRPPAGPSVKEYFEKSTTIARANQERVLRIGVQEDLPLMSEYDSASGRWSGFDVEIARFLAHKLGFTEPKMVEFVPLTTEKRISALQAGEVHLVVADFTITDDRRKMVRFAGPYFLTTPEVMIRRADTNKIRTIDDLKKLKVCTTGGSTSAQVLERHGVPHSLLTRGIDCAEGVRNGTYDAHCTDDVVIAGFVHRSPADFAKVDLPFSATEPLGVGIPLNDPYLEGLVAHFLKKQLALGARSQWQTAYDTTLAAALGPKVQPPLLPDYPELADVQQ